VQGRGVANVLMRYTLWPQEDNLSSTLELNKAPRHLHHLHTSQNDAGSHTALRGSQPHSSWPPQLLALTA